MKKQKESDKHVAYVLTFVVVAAILFSYIRHESHTIRVNGITYVIAGLVEQDDNGKKLYMPIYQRTQ